MDIQIQERKTLLRAEITARVGRLTAPQKALASAQAVALLERQKVWHEAASILFYAPLPHELDLWPLVDKALASGKAVALPRFTPEADGYAACQVRRLDEDLVRGRFGIREPGAHCGEVPLNRLDFVLVPGVGFDVRGWRLGRGKGFYDQLLAAVRGTKCGVAFDEQIVREIPVEPHDVPLNCILTPTRWLEPFSAHGL